MRNGGGNAHDADPNLDSDEEEEAHLAQLQKDCRRAQRRAEIRQLEEERDRGFAPAEQLTEPKAKRARFDKDQLAFERAKEVRRPDVYTGQSQNHLDRFFRQVETTFRTKLTIYSNDEDKCVSAEGKRTSNKY